MSKNNHITFSILPPDLIARIFTFLPISSFPSLACVSRRFKIILNGDNVYEAKLRMLGLEDLEISLKTEDETMNNLNERIKLLPGGHLLPAGKRYLV